MAIIEQKNQADTITDVTYTQDLTTPVFTLKTNPPDGEGDSASAQFAILVDDVNNADERAFAARQRVNNKIYVETPSNVPEPELPGVRESHGLSVGDKIKVFRRDFSEPGKEAGTAFPQGLKNTTDGIEYTIATVPNSGQFTLEGTLDTSGEDGVNPVFPFHYNTIEFRPQIEDVNVIVFDAFGVTNEFDVANISADSWYQAKLGNNPIFTAIAQQAAIASALVQTNIQFVQTGLDVSKVLLLAALNPQLLLLKAIADEIDKFVQDFKSTGIFYLEVTPRSMYPVPKDAEGNDIKLTYSKAAILQAYQSAITAGEEYQNRTIAGKRRIDAGVNDLRDKFETWARSKDGLNIGTPPPQLPISFLDQVQNGIYEIPQGATSGTTEAEFDGAVATGMMSSVNDNIFGLPRMTPSQVIATMISAMNEFPADPQAPNFSDSADVAAIVMILGVPDFEETADDLVELFELFMAFFGGGDDSPAVKAIKLVNDTIKEANEFFNNPEDTKIEIDVKNVCGIRGGHNLVRDVDFTTTPIFTDSVQANLTEDGEVIETSINNEGLNRRNLKIAGKEYNYNDQFEIGNVIIGPNNISGNKALAYVSKVVKTTPAKYFPTPFLEQDHPFLVDQTLEIIATNKVNKIAFEDSGSGAMIQKVFYYVRNPQPDIDRNSPLVINKPAQADYLPIPFLTEEQAKNVPLVSREPGKILLTTSTTEDLIERHLGIVPFRTHKVVIGKLAKPKVKNVYATPPNFHSYTIGQLLTPLEQLFKSIQAFTDFLRSFGSGILDVINKIYDFLNDMIDELRKLVVVIQRILKLFTDGLPDAGVYSLIIPSTAGGNATIINSLQTAAGRPPNSLDYSVGVMFMGGAAAIDPLAKLLGSGGGNAESRL
tara:strand:+ start:188 stop:2830 length:2643 start_codon:yes stop_codon:yes gene_type:complete